jgi:hypothetical protein
MAGRHSWAHDLGHSFINLAEPHETNMLEWNPTWGELNA